MDCGRSSHAWNHACVGPPLKQCANQSRKVKGLLSHWLVPSSGSFFDTATILLPSADPMESHHVQATRNLLPLLFLPPSLSSRFSKERNSIKFFQSPPNSFESCQTSLQSKHSKYLTFSFFFISKLFIIPVERRKSKSQETLNHRRRRSRRGGTSGSSPLLRNVLPKVMAVPETR